MGLFSEKAGCGVLNQIMEGATQITLFAANFASALDILLYIAIPLNYSSALTRLAPWKSHAQANIAQGTPMIMT